MCGGTYRPRAAATGADRGVECARPAALRLLNPRPAAYWLAPLCHSSVSQSAASPPRSGLAFLTAFSGGLHFPGCTAQPASTSASGEPRGCGCRGAEGRRERGRGGLDPSLCVPNLPPNFPLNFPLLGRRRAGKRGFRGLCVPGELGRALLLARLSVEAGRAVPALPVASGVAEH